MNWLMDFAGPEIPAPREFFALLILVPLGCVLAFRVLRAVFRDSESALIFAPGFTLLSFILFVHFSSLATSSFYIGLPVGTGLMCLAFFFSSRIRFKPSTASFREPSDLRASVIKVFTYTLLTLFCMLPLLTVIDGHDRATGVGHFTFVSQLVNGIYPLKNPFFPEQSLRYHFGVDLLAASLVSLLRLRVDIALNAVTVGLWIYFLQLAAYFGRRFCADRSGLISAFVLSVSGGIPVVCEVFQPGLSSSWLGYSETCSIQSFATNPPLISYLFQPPFALGMVLFVFGVSFFNFCEIEAQKPTPRRSYQVLLFLFITALSISHVVVFLTLSGTALLTTAIQKLRNRRYSSSFILFPVLAGVVASTRLGGFFAERSSASTSEFLLGINAWGHARAWWPSLTWNLITFGILGGMGIVGLLTFWRKSKWTDIPLRLAIVLTGTWITTNFIYYKTSWDIVKFATIASLCLALLAIPIFVQMSQKPALFIGCALITSFSPLFFLSHFWPVAYAKLQRKDPASYDWKAASSQDQDAINFLRTKLQAKDLVFVRPSVSQQYLFWGGISTPWLDPNEASSHGISRERIEKRMRALSPPIRIQLLLEEGVTYLLLSPMDRIEGFAEMIAENRVKRLATFSPLELYRVEPSSTK